MRGITIALTAFFVVDVVALLAMHWWHGKCLKEITRKEIIRNET